MKIPAVLLRGFVALALLAAGWAVAHEGHRKAQGAAAEANAFARGMNEAMTRMMNGMHRPGNGVSGFSTCGTAGCRQPGG